VDDGYGKLRRCTERNAKIVDIYLYVAAALVTIRELIRAPAHATAGTTDLQPSTSSEANCGALLAA
jgi:hypothetical protein